MNTPPLIETDRVRLTAPAADHAEGLFTYGRNPEFCEWIGSKPFISINDALAFAQQLSDTNAAGKRCYWVLVEKASRTAFGTVGFNFTGAPSGVLDFGYGLNPRYWGNGWFREAACAAIDHAFDGLHARRIQVITRADNVRSVESVRRLGFKPEGVLRAYYVKHGKAIDGIVLGLLKEDFV